jgi:G3E family GTPase
MATMVEDIPAFTRVTLLTGFLGSGKTTLLRRLLADPALKDTAVIINELGEVGIDHLLVERLDDQMVLLSSGCVCCTVRGELAMTMRDLHSRRERGLVPPFRRLVIESTGLADPFPVLSTLKADPVLRHHFRAAGVVTTVDAVNGSGQLDRYIESVRQVAVADAIVLTKTDIAEEAVTARLAARLDAINPSAPRLLSAAESPLDADALLQAGGSGWFKAIAEPSMAMAAHAGVRAFSITVDAPLDWTAFGVWLTMLLNRHGADPARQGDPGARGRAAAGRRPRGATSRACADPSERVAERGSSISISLHRGRDRTRLDSTLFLDIQSSEHAGRRVTISRRLPWECRSS